MSSVTGSPADNALYSPSPISAAARPEELDSPKTLLFNFSVSTFVSPKRVDAFAILVSNSFPTATDAVPAAASAVLTAPIATDAAFAPAPAKLCSLPKPAAMPVLSRLVSITIVPSAKFYTYLF